MMKHIFPVLTLLLLLVSCRSENERILYEVATADKKVQLSSDEDSPSCSVHLELAYATEENGHKAEIVNNAIEKRLLYMQDLPMKLAVDSFANEYTANYMRDLLPLYNADRTNSMKGVWYNYHYILKTTTEQGYDNASVYHIFLDYYEGGAHSVSQHLTMNFDNTTGRQLTLTDVFVASYEHKLVPILRKALCEQVGAKSIKELKKQGYLFTTDMYPSENFVLGEETITFIYSPSEIAPYEKGGIELKIAYQALDNILKKTV